MASFHDLDIFTLNKDLVPNDGVDSNTCIQSRYFSPHSFHVMKNQFCKRDLDHTFSIFHNNLDSLECEILDELDFRWHIYRPSLDYLVLEKLLRQIFRRSGSKYVL